MSRMTTHRNNRLALLQHEKHIYQRYLLNSLDAILHDQREHQDKIFSVIMPLLDNTKVRIAIGSHSIPRSKGSVTFHSQSVIEVTIPPTYVLIFNYNSTVHGGGPSNSKNTRIFTIVGDKNCLKTIEESNTINGIIVCGDGCDICSIMKRMRNANNGFVLPFEEGSHCKQKVGNLLNDYQLKRHGFCILKVSTDSMLTATVKNQVSFLDEKKGIKFYSIGQEEDKKGGGKRQMHATSMQIF